MAIIHLVAHRRSEDADCQGLLLRIENPGRRARSDRGLVAVAGVRDSCGSGLFRHGSRGGVVGLPDNAAQARAAGWRTLAALHARIEDELERALQKRHGLS